MDKLIYVMIGGGIGSGARYLVGIGALRWLGSAFPWGTLAVNVVGSFLLGAILTAMPEGNLRLTLGTGVMGGFTTYSAFNAETLRMVETGRYGWAAGYAGTTFVACLIAGAAGLWAGRV